MKEYKIYCNHCGKELNTMCDFDDLTIEMNHKWTTTDLCVECFDELYDIVYHFCNEKVGADK